VLRVCPLAREVSVCVLCVSSFPASFFGIPLACVVVVVVVVVVAVQAGVWCLLSLLGRRLTVAMQKSEEHELRPGRTRERTPPRRAKPIPVIGSSCTWRHAELDHFKVTTVGDVDVKTMIPERFFNFDHLEEYPECPLPGA
jgi:hypothetical protein